MAKDYTKYKLENLEESLSKARLVQKVLEIYLKCCLNPIKIQKTSFRYHPDVVYPK